MLLQPISWTSLAAFVVAGAGLVYYFKEEKRRVKEGVCGRVAGNGALRRKLWHFPHWMLLRQRNDKAGLIDKSIQ